MYVYMYMYVYVYALTNHQVHNNTERLKNVNYNL